MSRSPDSAERSKSRACSSSLATSESRFFVVVVFFAVVVSLVASGIACIAAPFLQLGLTPPNAMLVVGCGMVLLALGILAFFGAVAAAKGMVRLTADVARAIRKLFIRKENER